jgi:hypothetical protein
MWLCLRDEVLVCFLGVRWIVDAMRLPPPSRLWHASSMLDSFLSLVNMGGLCQTLRLGLLMIGASGSRLRPLRFMLDKSWQDCGIACGKGVVFSEKFFVDFLPVAIPFLCFVNVTGLVICNAYVIERVGGSLVDSAQEPFLSFAGDSKIMDSLVQPRLVQ